MLRKKSAKLCSLLLAVTLGVTLFSGCGKEKANTTNVEQKLTFSIADPKSIDPALNAAVDGSTVIVNAFEGLMKLDEKDKAIPGVAEKYEMSKDGLTYTFHLRKDAKWSDGKAVTANDFEYAWKRALNPDTAAEYAYQMYYVKNGEAYNNKKAKVEDVGVKAKDASTLEVTLEAPTLYFLELMAFPTYMPVRQDVVEKNKDWAIKPETYICNGAFKMKEWKPKDVIVFEKNTNYYDASKIKLTSLSYKLLEDQNALLNGFNTGQLDVIQGPPQDQIPSLVKSGKAKIFPQVGTYFYCINVSPEAAKINPEAAKALGDARVRKALTLAINRKDIVESVAKGGQIPAAAWVSVGLFDAKGKEFKKEYYKPEGDIAEAKKLLAEAGYPDGKNFPKFTLMYNTGAGHESIAAAVQEMWKQNLGITGMELKNQEFKVFQKTRQDKQYSIARHGWLGDYTDPMTFMDMWVTGGGNNDAGYSNAKYDEKVNGAKKETDPAKRMTLMREAEDILMEDMPIIPIYHYTVVSCIKPNVKGVRLSPLGQTYFQNVTIEAAK